MPVDCTEEGRVLRARVMGELDHHRAKEVMDQQNIPLEAVLEELDRRIDLLLPLRLTVDLSELTFTDSSGIAVLLRTWRHMQEVGGRMSVIRTPEQARRVFQAAGLDKLIPFA